MATTITVRHVPEEVRDTLASRAAATGRSLQEYMLTEVIRLASKPSMTELLEEVRARKRLTPETPIGAEAILADRDAGRR